MALSGYIPRSTGTLTSSEHMYHRITWSATQNKSANTSNITATLSLKASASMYSVSGGISGSLTIGGTSNSFSYSGSVGNTWVDVGSATVTVKHGVSGALVTNISSSVKRTSGLNQFSGTLSSSVTLDSIDRATSPELSDTRPYLNTEITITLNPITSGFTHTLQYSYGKLTDVVIASKTSETSIPWVVPVDIGKQSPTVWYNHGITPITLTCATFEGDNLVGVKNVLFSAMPSLDDAPVITSFTYENEDSGIEKQFPGVVVQNKSSIRMKATVEYPDGATLDSVICGWPGDIDAQASLDYTTTVIKEGSTENTAELYMTVRDSRNRRTSKKVTMQYCSYSDPAISSFDAFRCDASHAEAKDGTYLCVNYKGTASEINNLNPRSIKVEYKNIKSDQWTTLYSSDAFVSEERTLYSDASVLDINESYNVKVTLADFFSSTIKQTSISSVGAVMDFNISGEGMAIGKVSEKDAFEVGWPSEFKSNVSIATPTEEGSGDKLLDFELKSGNKLSSIGTEDSGDSLKLSMYSNNAESGSLKVKSDGSLLSTGVIGHAAITYYCNDLQRTLPTSLSALDFSYYNATSNHFTEWSSDSDITIKRSGVVLLSAGLYTTWLKGAAEISLLINRQAKGSTSSDDLAETHFSRNQTDSNYYSGSVSITPIVFSVSEGDVLQLQGMVNSDSSHKEQMFGYLHWLTIQWLE